jgi:hypothetical protein
MMKPKPTVADASYTMLLRNDAALLHAYCVREGWEIRPGHFDIYARACLTIGCLPSWIAFLDDRYDEAENIIGVERGIQLARILAEIAENQFSASCIQARAGVIGILNWVEGGCAGASPFENDMGHDPVWPVPAPLKERLMELRAMRFGWVVYPEGGDDTRQAPKPRDSVDPATGWIALTYPEMPLATEYPEVLVSEDELARYRRNLTWSDIMGQARAG